MRFQENINKEGKWYFYNQSALAFGRTEFRRRYGDRKLEDNWRRANKASISLTSLTENPGQANEKADTSKAVVADYKNPNFTLKTFLLMTPSWQSQMKNWLTHILMPVRPFQKN